MFYRKEKSQILSISHFLTFCDKKSWKSKIDINFQFSILNENWMDEWPTDLVRDARFGFRDDADDGVNKYLRILLLEDSYHARKTGFKLRAVKV